MKFRFRHDILPRETKKKGFSAHVNIDDPGQRVLGIGAALDGDAQRRLALLHDDAQVALVIGHDDRGVLLAPAVGPGLAGQPLGAVVPPGRATGPLATARPVLQQLGLLHVVAPRELVPELLQSGRTVIGGGCYVRVCERFFQLRFIR